MTKRKTSVSLDEWLNDRRTGVEIQSPAIGSSADPSPSTPSPTAEVGQLQLVSDVVTGSPKEVATTESEVAEWFWQLLAQAGFEIW